MNYSNRFLPMQSWEPLVICEFCGAVVNAQATATHDTWHASLDKLPKITEAIVLRPGDNWMIRLEQEDGADASRVETEMAQAIIAWAKQTGGPVPLLVFGRGDAEISVVHA